MYELRILDAAQFRTLVTMDDVILGVEEAFRLFSSGQAGVFPIITHEFDAGRKDMDIKSGYLDGAGIYGLKILGWNADNPKTRGVPALAGLIVVMDLERQQPVGILEGAPVTFLRTGAAGALGARVFARPASERAVIVGAGAQGRAQLLGLSKVMAHLKHVDLFDLNDAAADKMADEVRAQYPELEIRARGFHEMERYVRQADIVTTCTPSKAPLIKYGWASTGTHINAIGADMPGKQELETSVAATSKLFCDSRAQASIKGESQHAVAEGLDAQGIVEIGEVLNGLKPGRESVDEITVFDATGMALQDLITAKVSLERAEAAGIGTVIRMEQ